MIRCIPNHTIDKEQWDKTILNSTHPHLYARSWYLDVVSPGWKALVYNNYEYIMPLPIKHKCGIPYIVQPPLTQQLGIFSANVITAKIQQQFESKLFSHLSVRFSSSIEFNSKICKQTQRVNYILPLENSYENIRQNFSDNCKRNIKKSETAGILVQHVSLDFFIKHFKDLSVFDVSQDLWNTIQLLLTQAELQKSLRIYGAFFNNKICALAAFISSGTTLYYLIPGANSIAKKNGAAYAIVVQCIQDHAGTYKILDFEGSEIAGVAQFYRGFGAHIQPYYFIQKHSIPFLSLLIKN